MRILLLGLLLFLSACGRGQKAEPNESLVSVAEFQSFQQQFVTHEENLRYEGVWINYVRNSETNEIKNIELTLRAGDYDSAARQKVLQEFKDFIQTSLEEYQSKKVLHKGKYIAVMPEATTQALTASTKQVEQLMAALNTGSDT